MTQEQPPRGTWDADERGYFGDFGGRFMPEALVAALDELDAAWQEARADPAFRATSSRSCASSPTPRARSTTPSGSAEQLGVTGPAQARGPQPHRRPQDPQRARPGAADQADGQAAGHRRDRRRPARRRRGHRGGVLRARLHRLHGRGRHPPAGAQRRPDEAARRRGRAGRLRQRDPQGRDQRGAARLGGQRRPHRLPVRYGGRPAPLPEHGARLARGIGDEARAQCLDHCGRLPDASRPASAAAPTRSGCSRPSSTTRTSRSSASSRPATGSRPAGTPPRSRPARAGVLHGARTFVLQDEDGQTVESHSISAGLDYPGSAPSTPTSPRPAGRRTSRSPTPRRWTPWRCSAAPRGSSPRSSRRTRSRAPSTSPSGSPTRRAPRRPCWSTCAVAATRTWGPRSTCSASDPE